MYFWNLFGLFAVTAAFGLGFYTQLFLALDYFGIKYEKRMRRKVLWLIYYVLISFTAYWYLMYLLLLH